MVKGYSERELRLKQKKALVRRFEITYTEYTDIMSDAEFEGFSSAVLGSELPIEQLHRMNSKQRQHIINLYKLTNLKEIKVENAIQGYKPDYVILDDNGISDVELYLKRKYVKIVFTENELNYGVFQVDIKSMRKHFKANYKDVILDDKIKEILHLIDEHLLINSEHVTDGHKKEIKELIVKHIKNRMENL